MAPEKSAAFAFAQEVLDLAIELVTAFPAPAAITPETRRDPKLVGAALLCRSATNFRGALVLAHGGQPVESRSLVRMIFENFFFVAALCDHGKEFIKKMRSDEAANRKALGELVLQSASKEVREGEPAQIIRTQIRGLLEEFSTPKKFGSVKEVAGATVAKSAYVNYARLSMDGHPSITSLRRHLPWEIESDRHFLTITVQPQFRPGELLDTIDEACVALLGVCVGFNQLVGGTAKSDALRTLWERFEAQGRHAAKA